MYKTVMLKSQNNVVFGRLINTDEEVKPVGNYLSVIYFTSCIRFFYTSESGALNETLWRAITEA